MLRDESDPYSAAVFLGSWALEIRAGYTPLSELDVTERLNEYLDPDVPPNVEARLLAEVTRETERLLREAEEAEATWAGPTMNDRIRASFDELRTKGILAKECAGLTIQDGWGYVGLEAESSHEGAVFFHQQDVLDALHGMSLLLAFGGAQGQLEVTTQTRSDRSLHAGVARRPWRAGVMDRTRRGPHRDRSLRVAATTMDDGRPRDERRGDVAAKREATRPLPDVRRRSRAVRATHPRLPYHVRIRRHALCPHAWCVDVARRRARASRACRRSTRVRARRRGDHDDAPRRVRKPRPCRGCGDPAARNGHQAACCAISRERCSDSDRADGHGGGPAEAGAVAALVEALVSSGGRR